MDQENGKLTIYLVRHGQSAGNTQMRLDAASDKLSDRGKIEINLLGMHLSQVKFDYAYSSDLERAKCTAEGILRQSKVSGDTELQLETRLREVNFGIYEKSTYKEAFAYLRTLDVPPQEWDFPEGESFPQSGERVLKFAEEISERVLNSTKSSNVLFVSHSGVIMGFLSILSKSGHEVIGWDSKELKFMRNASYIKFEVKRKPEGACTKTGKNLLQFSFLDKFYNKHLDCISAGTGSHNVNPVVKFAKSSEFGKKYVGCVQQ